MRTNIWIIWIVLVLLPFNLLSQVWIEEGAVWHYDYSSLSGGGFIKITYEKDTLVDGINCQKLEPVKYNFTVDQFQNIIFLVTTDLTTQYTYSSGDTVFYYSENQFHILYDFGAQPGDTWNLGVDTNMMYCSESITHVDSVGTMMINGQSYRWISLSSLGSSSVSLNGKIIERFGAIDGYLFPVEQNCDSSIIVDFDGITFTCFEDNSFQLYNATSYDCEHLLSISDIEKSLSNHKLYPNPTDGILSISTGTVIKKIEIFNIAGHIVKKLKVNKSNTSIDVSNLPEGHYILRAIGRDAAWVEKFNVIR